MRGPARQLSDRVLMTFGLAKIVEELGAVCRILEEMLIGEKLRMFDKLCEPTLSIRKSRRAHLENRS
jgi:hypothetical protein